MIGRISSGDNRSILKIQKVVECCQRVLPLFLNYVKMFYLPQKRFVKFLKDSQNFHVIYRINVIRIHLCKKNCSCGCNNVQKIHKVHELCVLIANKHTCSHNVESRTKVVKTHEKKGGFFLFFRYSSKWFSQVVLENNFSENIYWCFVTHTHVTRLLC